VPDAAGLILNREERAFVCGLGCDRRGGWGPGALKAGRWAA